MKDYSQKGMFRRLAAEERCTVSVGFLILSVTFYLLVAAVWNTGAVIDRKVQTQAIADSVALSAASILASTANDAVVLNMQQMRLISAQATKNIWKWYRFTQWIPLAFASAQWAAAAAKYAKKLRFVSAAIATGYATSVFLGNLGNMIKVGRKIGDMPDVDGLRQRIDLPGKSRGLNGKVLPAMKQMLNDTMGYIGGAHPRCKVVIRQVGGKGYVMYDGYNNKKITGADFTPLQQYTGEKCLNLLLRLVVMDSQFKTVKPKDPLPEPRGSYFVGDECYSKVGDISLFKGYKGYMPGMSGDPISNKQDIYKYLVPVWALHIITNWIYYTNKSSYWYLTEPTDTKLVVTVESKPEFPSKTFMASGFFKTENGRAPETVTAVAASECSNSHLNTIGKKILFLRWYIFGAIAANYQARLRRVPAEFDGNTGNAGTDIYKRCTPKFGQKVFLH